MKRVPLKRKVNLQSSSDESKSEESSSNSYDIEKQEKSDEFSSSSYDIEKQGTKRSAHKDFSDVKTKGMPCRCAQKFIKIVFFFDIFYL